MAKNTRICSLPFGNCFQFWSSARARSPPPPRQHRHHSDLAQNWQVDIAAELEDYVEELDQISVTFGEHSKLNFAQGERSAVPPCTTISLTARGQPHL